MQGRASGSLCSDGREGAARGLEGTGTDEPSRHGGRSRATRSSSHSSLLRVYPVYLLQPHANRSIYRPAWPAARGCTSFTGFAIRPAVPDNFPMFLDDEIEVLRPDLPRGRF